MSTRSGAPRAAVREARDPVAREMLASTVQVVPRLLCPAYWGEGTSLGNPQVAISATLSSSFHDSHWERHFPQSQLLSGEACFFFFFLTLQVKQKFIPLKGKWQIPVRLSDYLFTGQ